MAVLIRPLSLDDTLGVVALYSRTAAQDHTVGAIHSEAWERFAKNNLAQEGSAFLVATNEPDIVGVATSSLRRLPQHLIRHFRIVVEPDQRRHGVASQLLRHLIATDTGTKGVLLQSLCPVEWQAGQAFLLRLGFTEVERELEMHCQQIASGELPQISSLCVAPVELPGSWGGEVARLHNLAYAHDRSFVPTSEAAMTALLEGGAELWVARLDDQLVGYCHVEPGERTCWIESLVIDPGLQRQHLGTQLIRRVLSDIIVRTQRTARLQVSDHNVVAKRLYENLGFTLLATSIRFRAPRDVVREMLGKEE